MNAPSSLLEQRLRRGLDAAAEAIPPVELARRSPARRPRRRWYVVALGGAAAAALMTWTVLVLRDGGERRDDVITEQVEEPPPGDETTTTTTSADGEVMATNGRLPGQAVVVGNELRTYGPDGAQTGTLSLDPLTDVQAASSDLADGWVACGMSDDASMSDRLVWFVPGESPRVVEAASPWCMADGIQVVDSPDGPTVIYQSMNFVEGGAPATFHAVVLATGEDRTLDIPLDPMAFYSWAATTGRLLLHSEQTGLQLFDLTTGEQLPLPDVPIEPGLGDLKLSADGTSTAWLVWDVPSDTTQLVVVDLTTGAEVHREPIAMSLEGAELSYDGTTVAVGNWYDGADHPPVTVFELANPEARRTIDAHGVLL